MKTMPEQCFSLFMEDKPHNPHSVLIYDFPDDASDASEDSMPIKPLLDADIEMTDDLLPEV